MFFLSISNSFGQACGGSIYKLNFVSYNQVKPKITEYKLFIIKDKALLDSINVKNDLLLSVPIDSILFNNLVDQNKKIDDFNPTLQWKVNTKNEYGVSIHFNTIELRQEVFVLKIKINNKNQYLVGNFFGGCKREQSFDIDNLILKQVADVSIGEINDINLYYNCFECTSSISKGIKIYANKKNDIKVELLKFPIDDYYLDEVKIVEVNNVKFILVSSGHTYGHTKGELFSIDLDRWKLNKININKSDNNIPDSLAIHKAFGLSFKKKRLSTGALLRSKKNRENYYLTIYYDLVKDNNNQYELKQTEIVIYSQD